MLTNEKECARVEGLVSAVELVVDAGEQDVAGSVDGQGVWKESGLECDCGHAEAEIDVAEQLGARLCGVVKDVHVDLFVLVKGGR